MSTSILIKKILVPIDGSDLSFKAPSNALHLAKMENADLSALNVVEDINQGGSIGLKAKYGNVSFVDAFRKVRKESAEQSISKIELDAKNQGVAIRGEILDDEDNSSESGVITEYADKNNFDLIVRESKGRSKLRRLLTEGLANVVVNNAKTLVLVVR